MPCHCPKFFHIDIFSRFYQLTSDVNVKQIGSVKIVHKSVYVIVITVVFVQMNLFVRQLMIIKNVWQEEYLKEIKVNIQFQFNIIQ